MATVFEELRRRKVFRVGAGYLVLGWVLIQVADTLAPMLDLPESAPRLVLFLLIVGFPISLFLAWAFEVRPTDGERVTAGPALRGIGLVALAVVAVGLGGWFVLWGRGGTEEGTIPPPHAATADASEERVAPAAASLAVLPFLDLSATGDQEYFGDGIAEELLNVLASIDELAVASRTSSFAFKGENRNLAEIGDILAVAHVLEGSVRRAGDRVRITAQLIDARADRHLWSETYDRELTAVNLFAIQDEIAQAIVAALRAELGISLEHEARVHGGTGDLNAYELFLQARQLEQVLSQDNARRRVELLERAVAMDPEFAEAWAALAQALTWYPTWDHGLDPEPWNRRSLVAAARALELDPLDRNAHEAREEAHFSLFDWEAYEAAAREAEATVPDYQRLPALLMGLGYLDRGAVLARARAEAGVHPAFHTLLQALNHEAKGRFREAIDTFEAAILQGYNGGAEDNLAWCYGELGDWSVWSAMRSRTLVQSDPALLPLVPHLRTIVAAPVEDRPRRARQFAVIAREYGFDVDDLVAPGPKWGLRVDRVVATALGRADRVADTYWGNSPMFWMWTPSLGAFRSSEAFRSRVRESGMLAYWQRHGFPDLCEPVGADDFACR